MKNILFHIPFKIIANHSSGTNIRPMKMLLAFQNLGFTVDTIMGTAVERKSQIEKVKKKIKQGVRYEFLYSESSTDPTLLSESHHLPIHPLLDFGFFKFCQQNNIKIGLFYRDIYWNFPFYGEDLVFWKRWVALFFYKYDLKQYRKYLSVLYLPSLKMLPYIPADFGEKIQVKELFPGTMHAKSQSLLVKEGFKSEKQRESITILYVGGIGSVYKLHQLFEGVQNCADVTLIICCREKEWESERKNYKQWLSDNVEIVHKQKEELVPLYERADIVSLYVEPSEYRNFAMPIKLFEYIKFDKPILATKGTAAAEFVEKNNVGWSIDYKASVLKDTLKAITQNIGELEAKRENIKKIADQNTWEARARKVVGDLSE